MVEDDEERTARKARRVPSGTRDRPTESAFGLPGFVRLVQGACPSPVRAALASCPGPGVSGTFGDAGCQANQRVGLGGRREGDA